MTQGLHEIAEHYCYPINCPVCQAANLPEDCHTCKGLGEIELQLTRVELAEIYKGYLELTHEEGSRCPYMMGEQTSQESSECPFTGAHKKS